MTYKNYNEKLIECNWLKMNENEILSNQKYDLILSEESINMLAFEHWDIFLDEISNRLTDNGYFIAKVMCKPPKGYFDQIKGENIINDWLTSEYNNDIGYLFVHLLSYLYELKQDNECINWKEVIEFVEKKQSNIKWNEKQKKEFFDTFSNLKDGNFIFYCKTEQELRDMLEKKNFYLEDVCYGLDDFDKFKFTPIYVLGKQSWRIGGQAKEWTTPEQELNTENRLASMGIGAH
eukprot:433925_1